MNRPLHPCIFLDRDGVINHDPGDYTFRPEDFRLLDGVGETLKHWQDMGYKFIVITNQGGIAKGLYERSHVEQTHKKMRQLLAEFGVGITDIFYSPYHQAVAESLSRKPSGLMIQRAMALHDIDPERSWMIGDRSTDAMAARQAGLRCLVIPTNSSLSLVADLVA
jgi:D-glycero-D-manno-heptose 1,7-bisphosphate phosphatase